MISSIPIMVFSLVLAAILGFAAHRANICTVKAVEEVLTTRHAHMLASFGKTILWVVLITITLSWFFPSPAMVRWQLSWFSIAGGLLFGVGATLNGGCAFAMLAKLAAGKLAQIATLTGFGFGAAGFLIFAPIFTAPVADIPGEALLPEEWTLALGIGIALWAVWEVARLWRGRETSTGGRRRIFAAHYSLSAAAILIGVSNAILYSMHGTWAYTNVLKDGVKQYLGAFADLGPVGPIYWILFLSLFLGMVFSTWQSNSMALDWRPRFGWLKQFLGGLLMGSGVAMVPGGNDVLILHAIPSLSPHAVPAYLAMIAGIALTLSVIRWSGGEIETIDCSSDICRVRD